MLYVFGSNLRGVHGAGAAKQAYHEYGAIYGQGEGLQGWSYAIPTKDLGIRTLKLREIHVHVQTFLEFVEKNQLFVYLTPIGTGLAGYQHQDIAPMFKGIRNAWLPDCWRPYLS
jgi:hypothetical protein